MHQLEIYHGISTQKMCVVCVMYYDISTWPAVMTISPLAVSLLSAIMLPLE